MSMALVSLNGFVDAIFAGRYVGADALAGVAVSMPLLAVNAAFTSFISAGASNVLSKAIGSRDHVVTGNLFGLVLIYSILAGLLLACAGLLFDEKLMELMGAGKGILKQGAAYYRWMAAGSLSSIFGLTCSAMIRGEGQMAFVTKMTLISVISNLVLNPIFILYFKLGVSGSALATIVSMTIYSMAALYHFRFRDSFIQLHLKTFRFDLNLVREIAAVGWSSVVMQLNGLIRQVILFRTVTTFLNAPEVPFFSAVFRMYSFFIIPVFGMVQALQPVVGINYGARQYERSIMALTIFRKGCCGLMLSLLLLIVAFSRPLLALLLPGHLFSAQEVNQFRLLMCVLPVAPLASTGIVYLQATGRAGLAGKLTLGREFVLFIPLLICLPRLDPRSGIYWGLFLENLLYVLIVFFVVNVKTQEDKKLALEEDLKAF